MPPGLWPLSLFQVPNFINTTLPPHEQVTAQEIDSYFRQELIYKRNERMGRRVMSLLRENRDKSFFFAFGAGMAWFFLFYFVTLEVKCLGCFRSLGLWEVFLQGFPLKQKGFCLSIPTSKMEWVVVGGGSRCSQAAHRLHSLYFPSGCINGKL